MYTRKEEIKEMGSKGVQLEMSKTKEGSGGRVSETQLLSLVAERTENKRGKPQSESALQERVCTLVEALALLGRPECLPRFCDDTFLQKDSCVRVRGGHA